MPNEVSPSKARKKPRRNSDTNANRRARTRQPEHVAESIAEVVELEHQDEITMTRSDVLARMVTNLSGSMPYVWLHAVWFGLWIMANVVLGVTFDEYPFGLLTTIVSLEAIFLSTFVLINQNRQALLADKRAKVDMQVNLIAEREITKLVEMTTQVQQAFGIEAHHDGEANAMGRKTRVKTLVSAVDSAEKDGTGPRRV